MNPLQKKLNSQNLATPFIHFVLGSGLSNSFQESQEIKNWKEETSLNFSEIPEIPDSSVSGHSGQFKIFQHQKLPLCINMQCGRLHGYEGKSPQEVVSPLLLAVESGTKNFVLSNASGSLQKDFHPGHSMIIDDHVNFTGQTPLYGKNNDQLGPRFPDMSECYSRELNDLLFEETQKQKLSTHRGNYVGVSGPSYETPAEVKLFSSWGIGAVGMSTVWEAIFLAHTQAKHQTRTAALSLISNFGTGLIKSDESLTHEEVLEAGRVTAPKIIDSFLLFAERLFQSEKSQ